MPPAKTVSEAAGKVFFKARRMGMENSALPSPLKWNARILFTCSSLLIQEYFTGNDERLPHPSFYLTLSSELG
ncbi:hypothetical protein J7K43_01625 [Candidatus Calescamantes bacterium]|nr:hypothetical protein [Candidatus Calescamantes bacterium]